MSTGRHIIMELSIKIATFFRYTKEYSHILYFTT